MARTKQASKRNRRSKAVPVLGAAGLSLSLASGASASTAADVTPQNTSPNHEIFLGEEEISDVSLSTFYVFDKENAAQPQLGRESRLGLRMSWLPLRRLPMRLERLWRLWAGPAEAAAGLGVIAATVRAKSLPT